MKWHVFPVAASLEQIVKLCLFMIKKKNISASQTLEIKQVRQENL